MPRYSAGSSASPANAASQLRAVLPADLAARLDLGQLAPVPASFVDEALKWRYSDLLFTVPMERRDAFVYVLVEHQSSSDPLMAFRMLRYMTRIWDAYLREHPEARRLPAVIPLVVHHGSRPWDSPVPGRFARPRGKGGLRDHRRDAPGRRRR